MIVGRIARGGFLPFCRFTGSESIVSEKPLGELGIEAKDLNDVRGAGTILRHFIFTVTKMPEFQCAKGLFRFF
jgi:hypothetical protein